MRVGIKDFIEKSHRIETRSYFECNKSQYKRYRLVQAISDKLKDKMLCNGVYLAYVIVDTDEFVVMFDNEDKIYNNQLIVVTGDTNKQIINNIRSWLFPYVDDDIYYGFFGEFLNEKTCRY